MPEDVKVVATNRKAGFEYFLLERFEAGLSLQGSEIKSIRAGQISLTEAYVTVDASEAWLVEAHIAPYVQASRMNHNPKRPRRLLLRSQSAAPRLTWLACTAEKRTGNCPPTIHRIVGGCLFGWRGSRRSRL